MTVLTYWNKRPDLTEVLVKTQGWVPHRDYPDMIWTKGDCVFTLTDRTGRSQLENRKEGFVIALFDAKTPARIILTACEQATER